MKIAARLTLPPNVRRSRKNLGGIVKSALIAACIIIAGSAASACDTLMVPSTRPISKIESRALPETAVIRRVVGQLGNILSVIPPAYPAKHPVTPLDEILFWTTARATLTPQICRADLVSFEFAVASPEKPDANTPTRVSGIRAQSRYRYAPEAPTAPDGELTLEQTEKFQAICSKFNPYESRFFVAESEDYALWAARLYERALREASNSPQKLTVNCYASDPECRTAVLETPLTAFASVKNCGRTAGPPEITCTKFEMPGSESLVVEVQSTGHGEKPEIQKVDADWQIYMNSVRID